MNAIVNFDFEDKAVRAVTIEGEPWFVGVDVCRCLNIANSRDALSRLDDDERRDCVGITDAIGRGRTTVVVSEPGVYQLVFTSRSPAAKRFKRWLAHEVLPQIRRTGRYQADPVSPPSEGWQEEIERLNAHVRLVAEARQTYGRAAARAIWSRSPLPQIDTGSIIVEPAATVDPADNGMDCLAHLLHSAAANGSTIGALIQFAFTDDVARKRLEDGGIKVIRDKKAPRVAIAERHPVLGEVFSGTAWDGDWGLSLLSIDGAQMALSGFGKTSLRCVHLPQGVLARVRMPN